MTLNELTARTISTTEANKPNLNSRYRSDIDGLRAVAVIAVIGFHCGAHWLRGGFVGVDIFFVISGLLISSIIQKEIQADSFSIAGFYERRFKRIIPALSAVIIFCLILGALVLSPYEASRLGDSVVAAALSLSNILFGRRVGYFDGTPFANPLLMTWSLAVEEQFYIVFPLLMVVVGRRSKYDQLRIFGVLTALSFIASVYCEFRQPAWNFYLPITRAWEIGSGVLLAVWQSGDLSGTRKKSWQLSVTSTTGVLLIIASIAFYRPGMRFPGMEAVPPVLGTLLILASPGGLANRLLMCRPLVMVGLISYSLYLWHWPLLSFTAICGTDPLSSATTLTLLLVTLVCASLSFVLIEKPFRRATISRSTVLVSYAIWIVFLTGLGGVLVGTRGLASRYPQMYTLEDGAALYRHHTCISANSYLRLDKQCSPESDTRPTMALLGDSHAEAVAPALQMYTSQQGWNLATLTRQSCPPTKGFEAWSGKDSTLAESCRKFNRSALDYVVRRPDIRVVFLTARWGVDYVGEASNGTRPSTSEEDDARMLRLGLFNEIEALRASKKQVLVMEDVPAFPTDPVAAIRNKEIGPRRVLSRLTASRQPENGNGESVIKSLTMTRLAFLADAQLLELKEVEPTVVFIDPKRTLCKEERCYFSRGDDLYYYDTMHLSLRGAMQIIPLLPNLDKLKLSKR